MNTVITLAAESLANSAMIKKNSKFFFNTEKIMDVIKNELRPHYPGLRHLSYY